MKRLTEPSTSRSHSRDLRPRRRRPELLLALALAALLAVAASSALAAVDANQASAAACPNEAVRSEQGSTGLPNCRAYEQVTPAAKDSGEPKAVVVGLNERAAFEAIEGARAALDGNRMAWVSEYSLPALAGNSAPGLDYLSTRGAEGWGTEATVPPQSPENGLLCPNLDGMVGWSGDLEKGVLSDGDAQEVGGTGNSFFEQTFACGHDEPRLVEGEPEGLQNLFLRDSALRTYRLVNVTPDPAPRPTPVGNFQPYFPPNFLAGSADLGQVVFEDELALSPEAEKLSPTVEAACAEVPKGRACWEGHDDVYVWSEGQHPEVRLVTIAPDGTPLEGALAGSTRNAGSPGILGPPANVAGYLHAVSEDGSRIFFEVESNLYVRENAGRPQSALGPGGECTEAAEGCTIELDLPEGGTGSGGGIWLAASANGARVFFSDENQLTADSTAAGGMPDLYEYDLEAQAGHRLSDLSVDASEPADVLGLSGVSEDGSYVYLVADGVLPGSGENGLGAAAQPGRPNLYVSHEGTTAFIATLGAEDLCDWTTDTGCNVSEPGNPGVSGLTARVSGDGRYLAFNSLEELTGYPNVGPECVELHPQAFAAGPCEEVFLYEAADGGLDCVSCNPAGPPTAQGAAIDWPAPPDANAELKNDYPQRNISEAGQVFFETPEPLLPMRDGNSVRDVYEYEEGTLHLVSGGTSSAPSYFLEADPGGHDVFFATAQPLLGRDQDAAYDIYDARVGGGFAEPPAPAPPCESGCRGTAGTSSAAPPIATTHFSAPGNLMPRKSKGSKSKKRRARLRSGLAACARRHRHDARGRSGCDRHVRHAVSKTTAVRRHHKEA